MAKSKYYFLTTCESASATSIQDMTDRRKEITYATAAKHISTKALQDIFPFYTWGRFGDDNGLRMKDDYAVGYYRSWYRGTRCIYIVYSAIEYIFVMR